MARFLSEEWFALVREAVAGPAPSDDPATATAAAPADPNDLGPGSMAVRHRVTGGPEGDVDYVVRAGSGRFSVEPGSGGPVDIDIVERYDSAAAISQGVLTPAAAFAAGRLKLQGDIALLAARQADFAALGDLLAPVRAITTY